MRLLARERYDGSPGGWKLVSGFDIGDVDALPDAVALLVGVGQRHLLRTEDTARAGEATAEVRYVSSPIFTTS